MERIWFGLGAIYSFLGIALGAFAAHALRTRLSDASLQIFEVGVRYQMYHGLALLAVGFAYNRFKNRWINVAGYCFVLGIFLFSGSLYAMVWTEFRQLGVITPVGGLLFLLGWLFLGFGTWTPHRFKSGE